MDFIFWGKADLKVSYKYHCFHICIGQRRKLDISTDFGDLSGQELENKLLRTAISAQFELTGLYEILASKAPEGDARDMLAGLVVKQKEHSKALWELLRKGDEKKEDLPKDWVQGGDETDRAFDLSH